MTLSEINKLDIVDYLASIGIHPAKVEGNKYKYLSPLRDEKDPSFKVNKEKNVWWDFGNPGGYSLVDFIKRYYKLTNEEVLQQFNRPGSLQPSVQQHRPPATPSEEKKVQVTDVYPIQSFYLERYLFERRIALDVARKFNQEVRYRFTGSEKEYYALGLRNDAGGYELRNKYHKYSADPKAPSTIINGSKDVALFEGNFNMLTLATYLQKVDNELPDFHVTNSSGNLEASLAKVDHYRTKFLFFDNDATGNRLTNTALARDSSYIDVRSLYKNHNDLNDWAQHIGKTVAIPPLQEIQTIGRGNTPDDTSGPHLRHGR